MLAVLEEIRGDLTQFYDKNTFTNVTTYKPHQQR